MKYDVTVRRIEIYTLVVDADSEEEAEEIADVRVTDNPEKFHNDSDCEIEAYEI